MTTYRHAVTQALAEELERDEDVVLFGEDVAGAGGVFKATTGLLDQFGATRVRDAPISEQAIVGCALGAAVTGLRPVAEIMFADFLGVCFDQVANGLAKYRYMSGGQARVPVTLRMANGAGVGFAAQHSQSAENWLLNVPGIKIAVPATARDAYALLKAAIRDDNPVIVFEHKALYGRQSEPPVPGEVGTFGSATIVRRGSDLTVVATQLMRHHAERAADLLAGDGISVELIDPRTLVPLDVETILDSVRRTGRLACIQESPLGGSWGATLVALLCPLVFDHLDAAPVLVSADDTPIPYAAPLEQAWIPSTARIVQALRDLAEV